MNLTYAYESHRYQAAVPMGVRTSLGWPIIVAPTVYAVFYVTAMACGARYDNAPRETYWQFIPAAELSADPARSLWFFHAQPPAVNVVFALTDHLGPYASAAHQTLLVVAALVLLVLVADTVWVWTGSRPWAVGTAGLAAVLPATTLYSMWLYPTLPIALLLVITLWGLVRGRAYAPVWPLALSAFGAMGLFLVRATMAWPLVLAWIIGLLWVVIRRQRSGGRPAGAAGFTVWCLFCLSLVGVLTVKNVVLFGAPTQSSWAKENYANVVLSVLTPHEKTLLAQRDPCVAELISVGTFQPLERYPACLDDMLPVGPAVTTPVLDAVRWRNGHVNLNHRGRLVLSKHWGELVGVSLQAYPDVPVRVLKPVQTEATHAWGSPVLLFGPSTRYVLVRENMARLGWLGGLWAAAFAWVPPVAALCWLLGIALMVKRRAWRFAHGQTYLGATALAGVLSLTYLLLEFGENQRFQVEVLYAWIMLGAAALHWVLTGRRLQAFRARRARRLAPGGVTGPPVPPRRALPGKAA